MNEVISLNPVFPFYTTLPILLVLAVLFIWIEIKKNHKFKTIRIVAVAVMLFALWGIISRPNISYETSTSVILLTRDYDKKQVDSVIEKLSNPAIYHLDDVKPYRKSVPVKGHQLAYIQEKLNYVIGNGIPLAVLDGLDTPNFVFISAPVSSGITNLHVDKPVVVNRESTVSGIINDPSVNKIVLKGPGSREDSVVNDKGTQTFTLSFRPKQEGNFLYTLSTFDREGNLREEKVPVTVEREEPLKILFIQHFPTFETQYLKQFLAKKNSIVLRNQLSKNIFRYEYVNHTNVVINKLTDKVLSGFDLLFIDTDSYKDLAGSEISALKQSLQEGLGVILLLNESPDKIRGIKTLLPEFAATKTDTAIFKLTGNKKITLPVWPLAPKQDDALNSITKSGTKVFSGYKYHGLGRVGFQLLQETYRTTLEGDSATYSLLWTELLEKVSRRKAKGYETIFKTSEPYYQDEPFYFDVIATDRPAILIDSIPVPLAEDLYIDNIWHGKAWGGKSGWHTLLVTNDSTEVPFYVHDAGSWEAWKSSRTWQENKAIASDTVEERTTEEKKPVSPLIFYLAFLISAGFLWFAPKL
ncbi:hypothetical protein [Chryseosolibacter indicus]|uniref:VWA domain-containing protein n=1 Tax=Chryseosolibacter indicus TaxID=2782351 RepID=A0ABS5VNK3_9BACT|nr:hypothetical protein [Chryseosolibacter indicus]MBT1702352.1 hypothetical protein [Chryseosolibacter indicus]